jgi:carbon storage regulator CsrA
MLSLSRNKEEEIVIGTGDDAIVIKIIAIRPDRVKIGVEAPPRISVWRSELLSHQETPTHGLERSDRKQSV